MLNFATHFVSIVLEALPFLLLGSMLSGLIEVYLPQGLLARKIPRHPLLSGASGLFLGLAVPTCECGSVPVVRRLLAKGAPPPMAFAYLLAATVVNPMVLFTTWIAFPHKPYMVLLRAGASLLVAALMTAWIVRRTPAWGFLPLQPVGQKSSHYHGDHCPHCQHASTTHPLWRVLDHARHEFSGLFAYLVLGSAIAASFQLLLPDGAWLMLSNHPALAIPGLMLFAFALSLCSEADAFLAASLSSVPTAAQLAFLVLGPVLDIKLLLMYKQSFAPRVVRSLWIGLPLLVLPVSVIVARFVP